MNILAIMPSYRPEEYSANIGGGERSNRILMEGLAAKGNNVTVFTWNAGGFGSAIRRGVRVVELGGGFQSRYSRIKAVFRFRGLVHKFLKEVHQPDVLVCGTEGLGVALDLARIVHAPVGLFVRAFENFEAPPSLGGKLARKIKSKVLGDFGPLAVAKANFILPNSDFMETYCFSHLGMEMASEVVFPPLDWRSCVSFDIRPIRRIAMVGNSEKKGIKLVEYLAHCFPQIEFRVLGAMLTMDNSKTLPKNLHLLGWSDIKDEFSNRADAVLVPSLWEEPFGRVAIEALACGKPPLVSDIGGLPETVFNEPMLCLQPGNKDAWRKAVERLIDNPEPFVIAAKRAAASLDRFSAEQQIEKLEKALHSEVSKFFIPIKSSYPYS